MSTDAWTLDQDSEKDVLLPWLAGDHDPDVKERVTAWLGDLVGNPLGRGVEDAPGVFSVEVPRAKTAVVWTLNPEKRVVVLLHIGPV